MKYWFQDLNILFQQPMEFFPKKDMNKKSQLNSIFRLAVYYLVIILLLKLSLLWLNLVWLLIIISIILAFNNNFESFYPINKINNYNNNKINNKINYKINNKTIKIEENFRININNFKDKKEDKKCKNIPNQFNIKDLAQINIYDRQFESRIKNDYDSQTKFAKFLVLNNETCKNNSNFCYQ